MIEPDGKKATKCKKQTINEEIENQRMHVVKHKKMEKIKVCAFKDILFQFNIIYWLFYLSPTKKSCYSKYRKEYETWTINQFIIIVNLSGGCNILTHSCSRMKLTKFVINEFCYWFSLLRLSKSAPEHGRFTAVKWKSFH